MKKNDRKDKNSDLFIDESKHVTAPDFFQRLRNSIYAIFMGAIFAQVMLFTFGMNSLVIWYDHLLFISFLIVCAVLGWVAGEKFIETLGKKSDEWWDLWGYFRQK